MKKQQKSSVTTTIIKPMASPPPPSYPTGYYCQQPNCSCGYNNYSSSYYSSPYVYTQPMFIDTQVNYQ